MLQGKEAQLKLQRLNLICRLGQGPELSMPDSQRGVSNALGSSETGLLSRNIGKQSGNASEVLIVDDHFTDTKSIDASTKHKSKSVEQGAHWRVAVSRLAAQPCAHRQWGCSGGPWPAG